MARLDGDLERLTGRRVGGDRDHIDAGNEDLIHPLVADGERPLHQLQITVGDLSTLGGLGGQEAQFLLGNTCSAGDSLAGRLQVGEPDEQRHHWMKRCLEQRDHRGHPPGDPQRVPDRIGLRDGLGIHEHDEGQHDGGQGDSQAAEPPLGQQPGDGGSTDLHEENGEEHGVHHPRQVLDQPQETTGPGIAVLGQHLDCGSPHPQQGRFGGAEVDGHSEQDHEKDEEREVLSHASTIRRAGISQVTGPPTGWMSARWLPEAGVENRSQPPLTFAAHEPPPPDEQCCRASSRTG